MTSVRGRGQPARRGQISETLTGPLSSNEDHEDPQGSNKPGPSQTPTGSKVPTGPETPTGPKTPPGLPQAPPLQVPHQPGANNYSQQDLDRIIQTFLHVSKGGSRDKLKAKSLDVYCGRSHIECYNFCQQCEDHFVTCGATGPYRIPFAASFLRKRIKFRWQQYKRKLDAESSIPISWDKFKAFVRKALGDFRAFVDSYWTKIRWDSQYHQEETLDWAAHLEHLPAMLKEFDPISTPNKTTLIRYFREGLRPSIRAQLDHRGQDLDAWEEAVEKAGDTKAKTNYNLPSTLGISMLGARKTIARQQKRTKKIPIGSPAMRPPIKTRLSLIPPLLLTSLRPKPQGKTSAVIGEAIQPLGSTLPR